MTAPAVGHRPPDPGPDMSLYDYGAAQPQDDIASPRNDSAMRAEDSAQGQIDDSQKDLPAFPGMFRIGTVLERSADSLAPDNGSKQSDLDKQSAASSLLAQLLGNQPPPPTAQEHLPKQESQEDTPGEQNVEHTQPLPNEPEKPAPAELTATQDGTSLASESHGLPEIKKDQEVHEEHAVAGQDTGGDVSSQIPNLDAGVLDRLISKSQGQTDSFAFFDTTAAPKNALEALQQNDMLTSLYTASQSLDMSGLPDIPGYSQGNSYPDAPSSIAGSEPRIQAFAKLEFDDGHFYVNTYSFILGRDVRAARAALQREMQARQAMGRRTKSSSGGNTSHTPNRVKREGSAIIGSVVSDRGGIMGFDPDVPSHLPPQLSRKSSNSSYSGPPLHANPSQLTVPSTDYNALAMQSLYESSGDAKPVDTLALLPSPDACPTIPIHPPATADGSAAGHRGISRKHVKIAYNFDKNLFEMEVIGRNGAFIGADWLAPGQVRPLHSGDYIQIGGVRIRFLLPDVPIGETGADRADDSYMEEDENAVAGTTAVSEDAKVNGDTDGVDNGGTEGLDDKEKPKMTKIVLKTKEQQQQQPDPSKPRPSIEVPPETPQQPVRRRGPGRPPKDGIMSKRERAEIAREQKLAAKREANGGVTPPPSNRSKVGRPRKEDGSENGVPKPEKRKYTKRKKPDGTPMDVPIPSVEGGEAPTTEQPAEEYPKAPPVKKRKPSRSPSPNYPPESAYTPEDLAKPPYNYAVLIFDALTESQTPMTLKQIYRALKLKYPYFRFKCETEGWTSSVRHNLNGNSHLFMHAERDGKGWSWQLRPGASVEKEKKRRPSPPPPSQPPPAAANTQQHYMPPPGTYASAPGVPAHLRNQQFQFPSMPHNPYTAPAPTPQHSSPYPPAQTQFPISNPIRNNLPPAFAQTTPSTYTSPYASDPPPQLQQLQQQQQAQQAQQPGAAPPQQHQSPYAPQNPSQLSNVTPGPQPQPPPPAPQMPPAPNPNPNPTEMNQAPVQNEESLSFTERANKAIDDFEAVLMEDYDDKNYIREVLKSARARVLDGAQESSFPGGEPKDEAVIMDALRNLIGSLKEE